MGLAEYTKAWIEACKEAQANSHQSLALLRVGIADAKQGLLWFDLFWFKRDMSPADWGALESFIAEAFHLWPACKTRLVICSEAIDGTVTFNSGSRQLPESTRGLLEKAYRQALSELRSVA